MNLNELRKKINSIDEKLVKFLNERADVSLEIGKIKEKNKSAIYSPEREKEVLERIRQINKGPMTPEAFEAIYREIMSSSLALEKKLKIAYLGTVGSFTHMAAIKKFGSQIEYISCTSILEVFQKVEQGECDYGVVPVENTTEGAVTHTFDLLVDSDLKVCAQTMLKISHCLLSKYNMKDIKVVYSNPNAAGQCRNWLAIHLPQAGQVWVSSTTEAAQKAAKQAYSAAIASSLAAKEYELPILAKDIQDIPHNMTRFLVLAVQDVPPTGKDRTSILFSIKDKVGALHAMLTPFTKYKINLTKIESRPSKRKAWDYYFFVDLEGHREEAHVKKALEELEGMCKYLKIVGSYPV
ncbi:MAG TPA: prephenate dehydratase [Candidatus Omnitrophota bacterium]|nr:prephenate dehydratase [Candidatus Omnitrophota bacterium]